MKAQGQYTDMVRRTKATNERVTIIVEPSEGQHGVLTVQDAMRQVFDVFDYIADDSKEIVWKLVYASTNSPLCVEAEAVSFVPGVDVRAKARAQKARAAQQIRSLTHGQEPQALRGTDELKRVFARNVNGIGRTEIKLSPAARPLVIEPKNAQTALDAIVTHQKRAARAHVEVGSLEGRIVNVGLYYGYPAITIKERKSGRDVVCRVSAETRDQIERDVDVADVWDGRRVIVRGRIRYDDSGTVSQVDANHVERIKNHPDLGEDSLFDKDFTGGLSAQAYLDDLREG